jgi:hypothetical protein
MAGLIAHLHLGVSIFYQPHLFDAERAIGIGLGVAIIYVDPGDMTSITRSAVVRCSGSSWASNTAEI